jgi:Fe2+ transport system protein FeoA
MYVGIDLAKAPLDTPLTLIAAETDAGVKQRLASLGLRPGAGFSLVSRTSGGGRVALVAGSRIALGKSLLPKLHAEVLR